MTRQEVRRRCEALAQAMTIPEPFDLPAFLGNIGADRGRRIQVVPFLLPPGAPRGVCVAGDAADYIVVDAATTGNQRTHIVLHEVSHLLLRHELRVVDCLRHLFKHLDLDVLQARLAHARTNYSTVEEREAETLASLLGQRAHLWRPQATPATTDSLTERISLSLEDGT